MRQWGGAHYLHTRAGNYRDNEFFESTQRRCRYYTSQKHDLTNKELGVVHTIYTLELAITRTMNSSRVLREDAGKWLWQPKNARL